MYNYSIIIPHKNCPDLLERCLASIPRRDDTQVIVVDDDSDPSKVDFANFPGTGRPNTEIVFSKNEDGRRGAGVSRNRALDMAAGKWVIFVDSDDFLLPGFDELLDRHIDSPNDLTFFGNTRADCDTLAPFTVNTPMKYIADYLGDGDTDRFIYRMSTPWGRIIRRSVLEDNNIRFSEVRCCEDMIFCARCNYFSSGIGLDPSPYYCYTYRLTGALSSLENRTVDYLMIQFDEDMKVARFLQSVGKIDVHQRLGLRHWKELMRRDRRRAKPLLEQLREVYPAKDVARFERKMRFDHLVAPFRKLFLGKQL